MRSSALLVAGGALVLVAAGCAISLDDSRDASLEPDGGPPALGACSIFADEARGVAAVGRVRSFASGDDTVFAVDALTPGAGAAAVAPAVFAVASPDAASCLRGQPATLPTASGLDASALGPDVTAALLATFVAGTGRFAYVVASQGLTTVGVTLAAWDDGAAAFVAQAGYLFTGDRPTYGDAALVAGDTVYAYGCAASGFLRASCYVARAPADRLGDPTAYEFYRQGGDFGSSADEAWPIFDGGGGLAVVARGSRVYAAYATPLGGTIHLRSGLGPTGPWSDDLEVTTCDLAAAGAFCTGVSAHEALAGSASVLALTYAVASFDPLPAAAAASRLVMVPLAGLP